MPEQYLSPEEHRIMQDAFVYLRDHCCPPPNNGSNSTIAWWTQAGIDAGTLVSTKWKNHPLMTEVMVGLLNYLGMKAKEAYTDAQSL